MLISVSLKPIYLLSSMNNIFRFCYSSVNSLPKKEKKIESGDSIDRGTEEEEEEEKIEEREKNNNIMGLKLKDTFYISHGSPSLAIDDSIPARKFLKSWKEVFPTKPSAILIISGHWDTDVPTVNAVDVNETIYDFYGFPKSMYKLKYPAAGSPQLAKRVKELLTASGISRVNEDRKRGLDHGAWVPLLLMYPEADIPVCQLSVSSNKGGTFHYNMGKALAPLKDEGVLIIGSGSATHNMREFGPRDSPPPPWAVAFMSWLKSSLLDGRYEEVNDYEEKAPYAKKAHPWPDHFFPLHVAMGASGENSKAEVVHDSWDGCAFSYASFGFKAAPTS